MYTRLCIYIQSDPSTQKHQITYRLLQPATSSISTYLQTTLQSQAPQAAAAAAAMESCFDITSPASYSSPSHNPIPSLISTHASESQNIDCLMDTMWYGNPHPHHLQQNQLQQRSSSPSSSLPSPEAREFHGNLAYAAPSDTVLQLISNLFCLLDRDRDGRVTVEEIQCLLQKLTIPDLPSDDSLISLIQSLRPNPTESPYLDLVQFRALYHSLFPQEKLAEEYGIQSSDAEDKERETRATAETEQQKETITRAKIDDDRADKQTRAKMLHKPETLTLTLEEEEEWEEDVMEAFRVFDRDGDGFISAGELAIVLRDLELLPGPENAEDTCRQLIGRVDSDGNGMVDIHEFKTMLTIHA